MKDAALITLHGMGKDKEGYFLGLEKCLKDWLGIEWERVSFQNVLYAPILQEPQSELWRAIVSASENDIDSTKIRQFFLYGFGDAGSLEYSAHRAPEKYLEVQREIQRALGEAYIEMGEDKSKPVVIIAQSLGCQVLSNYLWDSQKEKYIFNNPADIDADKLEFLRLKSLRNLFTTGCNIPLFVSGLSDRECFEKPNNRFKWDNYYDPDDVLGWPLRQLGSTFRFIRDHHINAGGLLTSWNPLSHVNYWSDNDVVRPLANVLLNHLT